jgi:hypothetical protein
VTRLTPQTGDSMLLDFPRICTWWLRLDDCHNEGRIRRKSTVTSARKSLCGSLRSSRVLARTAIVRCTRPVNNVLPCDRMTIGFSRFSMRSLNRIVI